MSFSTRVVVPVGVAGSEHELVSEMQSNKTWAPEAVGE